MNKADLIKDAVILSNITRVMRLATNKVIARVSESIKTPTEELDDTGSAFHMGTLAARLSLSEKIAEEPSGEEPKSEDETPDSDQE